MKHRCTVLACLLFAAPGLLIAQQGQGQPQSQPPGQTAPDQVPPSVDDIRKALGEPETVTATVAAIDFDNRMLTLRDESGVERTLYVGDQIARLKALNVGDRISATYYMSIATIPLKPGEPPRSGSSSSVVGTTGTRTASEQVRWVVTVTEVNQANQTVTVTGEQGRSLTVRVDDKARLAEIKPQDRIEVVLTAALLVSVDPAR